MFSKILIANRGEIACRIIRTAKKMGIQTVAVYSDADAQSMHVSMADEAYYIGPSQASESYLASEKIIAIAKQSGAEAIHPGYGFLSENAQFCSALQKEGIVFIGPNAEAIKIMGDKIESKKYASQVGVSTIPGFLGEITDIKQASHIAQEIGYPVMIKASAGGGGKGMRIAHSEAELEEGLTSAVSEAKSSFGDERVFIEKYIQDPHHIEIQVLGDKHGNVIHLFERECSIQRRNQKVIEETPSPFIDDKTRQEMVKQSIKLSQAVNYDSAGTVEFVVGADKSFYFLEMNTRLQVEHPVTELVTGIDIVEHMISIASGEPLSIKQENLRLQGAAIEARVYSENPRNNFLPSIGRIKYYQQPYHEANSDVTMRIDTGIKEGSEISIYYDPMIAKLCVHAADRESAISNMAEALNTYCIKGVEHNLSFLSSIMRNKNFIEGNYTTHFVHKEYPNAFTEVTLSDQEYRMFAIVATHIDYVYNSKRAKISGRISDVFFNSVRVCRFEDDREITLEVDNSVSPKFINFTDMNAKGKDNSIVVETHWKPGDWVWKGKINGKWVNFLVSVKQGDCYALSHMGAEKQIWVYTQNEAKCAQLMPRKVEKSHHMALVCPMPGVVLNMLVKEGQELQAGEQICTIEAMKMENILRSVQKVKVKKIHYNVGDKLAHGSIIMDFEDIV